VQLTAAVTALLGAARRAHALAAAGVDAARRAGRGDEGTLTIGFSASTMLGPAAAIVSRYRERVPGVQLRLREMVTTTQLAALRSGDIDAGFLREPPLADDIAGTVVAREPFAMALPKGHPLARRPALPLRALANEAFVLFPREAGPAFFDQIIGLCAAAGFTPRITQYATEWQTVVGLVAAGLGVSVVPDCMRAVRAPGVTYRPLPRGSLRTSVVLAWRAADRSPALGRLVALTAEHGRRA
jgi:DNA-binding transcriptional LysR family regulator